MNDIPPKCHYCPVTDVTWYLEREAEDGKEFWYFCEDCFTKHSPGFGPVVRPQCVRIKELPPLMQRVHAALEGRSI